MKKVLLSAAAGEEKSEGPQSKIMRARSCTYSRLILAGPGHVRYTIVPV